MTGKQKHCAMKIKNVSSKRENKHVELSNYIGWDVINHSHMQH